MDTTKRVTCPKCGYENMEGFGGSFGGRIMSWKKKCPECGLVLLIVPMKEEYDYTISARTEEETNARFKKEQKLRELEKESSELRNELRY